MHAACVCGVSTFYIACTHLYATGAEKISNRLIDQVYLKGNKETQASDQIIKKKKFVLKKKITGLILRLLVKITNLSIQ